MPCNQRTLPIARRDPEQCRQSTARFSGSHVAQKIKKAKRTQTEPKVLVIDYFHVSAGTSSRLGTLLADRFSESLGNFSNGMRVLDRNILEDF